MTRDEQFRAHHLTMLEQHRANPGLAVNPAHGAPRGAPPPLGTTGTKLKELLAEVGITEFKGCACNNRAAQMDRLGVAWCEGHRDEIAAWLAEAASKAGWLTKGIAAAKLLTKPWFRVTEPLLSIVDEAIRRSKYP